MAAYNDFDVSRMTLRLSQMEELLGMGSGVDYDTLAIEAGG